MKTYTLLFGISVAITGIEVNSQEAAALGDQVRTDTSAIAMSMDAKNAAILAILQKLTTCNAQKAFYQPGDPAANSSGCVSAMPTSTSSTSGPAGVFTYNDALPHNHKFCAVASHAFTTRASAGYTYVCSATYNTAKGGWVRRSAGYNNSCTMVCVDF